MPRFLLVRGHAGVLVPNPHVIGANPSRWAGMRLDPAAPPGPLVSLHVPCEELLLNSPDLRSAARAGHLDLLGECVAKDHTEARALLAPPVKQAPRAPEVK
jgi:hypothetical protein